MGRGAGPEGARKVAQAGLLWEEDAGLAVRLRDGGLGEVDLAEADLVLGALRCALPAGIVLVLGSHYDLRILIHYLLRHHRSVCIL